MEQQQGHIHIRKIISHKSGVPYGSMLNFGAILGVNLDESSIEPSSASGWSGNCSPWFRPFFLHGQRFRRSSYVHSISTLSPAARFKNIPIEGDLWWFDVIFLSEHDLQGLGICFKMFQAQQISLWSAVSWKNRALFAAAPLKWVGPCSLYMSPGVKLGIQCACCGICEKPKPEHHLYTNPAKMR